MSQSRTTKEAPIRARVFAKATRRKAKGNTMGSTSAIIWRSRRPRQRRRDEQLMPQWHEVPSTRRMADQTTGRARVSRRPSRYGLLAGSCSAWTASVRLCEVTASAADTLLNQHFLKEQQPEEAAMDDFANAKQSNSLSVKLWRG